MKEKKGTNNRHANQLAGEYTSALREYLHGEGEWALLRAYEIGRRAVLHGLGVIDIAELHTRAMKAILSDSPPDQAKRLHRRAAKFYEECLAPFEIAFRGFREATMASQEMVKLASMAYHELRASLSSVLASAGMLQDLLPTNRADNRYNLLANVLTGANILKARTDDLMDIMGFYSGALSVNLQQVDPVKFLRRTYEYLLPEVRQKGLTFKLTVPSSLPRVNADGERLQQVITNLVQNALKYAADGGYVEIRAAQEKSGVLIEVRDRGSGIAPEQQDGLFDLYKRVARGRTHASGLGIGLVLCQRIVEAHGGSITLETAVGQGSKFQIHLLPAVSSLTGQGLSHEGTGRRGRSRSH